jgi:hypothetical protein
MRITVRFERMKRSLQRPSIEASLSRKSHDSDMHPIAKRLSVLPMIGSIMRAWVRSAHADEPARRWASLPPFAAVG